MKTLEFKDLNRIGHTHYSEDDKLVICCDNKTVNIEFLLLREILSLKGYSIIEEAEFLINFETDEVETRFFTDCPFSVYEQL